MAAEFVLGNDLTKLPQLVSRINALGALEQRLGRIEERLGSAKPSAPARGYSLFASSSFFTRPLRTSHANVSMKKLRE